MHSKPLDSKHWHSCQQSAGSRHASAWTLCKVSQDDTHTHDRKLPLGIAALTQQLPQLVVTTDTHATGSCKVLSMSMLLAKRYCLPNGWATSAFYVGSVYHGNDFGNVSKYERCFMKVPVLDSFFQKTWSVRCAKAKNLWSLLSQGHKTLTNAKADAATMTESLRVVQKQVLFVTRVMYTI